MQNVSVQIMTPAIHGKEQFVNNDLMFSSKTNEWATPMGIYRQLDDEFHFNLDPCATVENHKCPMYFTKEQDGLSQNWGGTESFAIHLTVKRLASGWKSVLEKGIRMTRLLYYLFLQEQIPPISMITF